MPQVRERWEFLEWMVPNRTICFFKFLKYFLPQPEHKIELNNGKNIFVLNLCSIVALSKAVNCAFEAWPPLLSVLLFLITVSVSYLPSNRPTHTPSWRTPGFSQLEPRAPNTSLVFWLELADFRTLDFQVRCLHTAEQMNQWFTTGLEREQSREHRLDRIRLAPNPRLATH